MATPLGYVVISLLTSFFKSVASSLESTCCSLPLPPLYFLSRRLTPTSAVAAAAQACPSALRRSPSLQPLPTLPPQHQTTSRTSYSCERHRRTCRYWKLQQQRRRVISLTCCSHPQKLRCFQPADQHSDRRTDLHAAQTRQRPEQRTL